MIADHHAGAEVRQHADGRCADAVAPPGDNGVFSGEVGQGLHRTRLCGVNQVACCNAQVCNRAGMPVLLRSLLRARGVGVLRMRSPWKCIRLTTANLEATPSAVRPSVLSMRLGGL